MNIHITMKMINHTTTNYNKCLYFLKLNTIFQPNINLNYIKNISKSMF